MAPLMSGSGGGGCGGSARRRPMRQPPVVDDDDVGCSCPKQRLLRSLLSSLMSRARGALGGRAVSRPKSSAPPSSSASTTTAAAAAFTSTSTTSASATTVDSSVESWGPATYAATNTLYEVEDVVRRQRRKDRRRRRRRRRAAAREEEEEEEGAAAVAVEVESAAPYEDFRESMVAMVVEKEMYAWEELNALLHQFLTLNSPRHHALILHAFADLWAPRSGLFCAPSPCQAL